MKVDKQLDRDGRPQMCLEDDFGDVAIATIPLGGGALLGVNSACGKTSVEVALDAEGIRKLRKFLKRGQV